MTFNCSRSPGLDPQTTETPQNCTSGQLFDLNVESGKVYRLRLINVGTYAGFWFSIDSHNLTIIEAEGVDMVPIEVPGLFINIGQRYSVLLNAIEPVGNYIMRYFALEIGLG